MELNEGWVPVRVGTGGPRGLAEVRLKEELPPADVAMCCWRVSADMGVRGWRIPAVVVMSQ